MKTEEEQVLKSDTLIKSGILYTNLVLAITGYVFLILSVIVHTNRAIAIFVLLVIFAALVFVLAYVGIRNIRKYDEFTVYCVSAALLVVFIIETAIALSGAQEIHNELGLIEHMIKNYHDNTFTKYYDEIQINNTCCGVHGPEDWIINGIVIPSSCCPLEIGESEERREEIRDPIALIQPCHFRKEKIHYNGCLPIIRSKMKENSKTNTHQSSTPDKTDSNELELNKSNVFEEDNKKIYSDNTYDLITLDNKSPSSYGSYRISTNKERGVPVEVFASLFGR